MEASCFIPDRLHVAVHLLVLEPVHPAVPQPDQHANDNFLQSASLSAHALSADAKKKNAE